MNWEEINILTNIKDTLKALSDQMNDMIIRAKLRKTEKEK